MATFAPDFSHFWRPRREEPDVRERVPAPVPVPVDPEEALLRELDERINAARSVV